MAEDGGGTGGRRRVEQVFADAFDIPRDAIADLPRLVVIGDSQLRIDNHRGLIACCGDRVTVGTGAAQLTIRGQDLVVEHIDRDRLLISGRIQQLLFER